MARNASPQKSSAASIQIEEAAADLAIKALRKRYNGVLIFPEDMVSWAEDFALTYVMVRVPKRYRAFHDERPMGRPMGSELQELINKLIKSSGTEEIAKYLSVRYGPRFRDWVLLILKDPRKALLLLGISKTVLDTALEATDIFQPVTGVVYKSEMETMYRSALAAGLLMLPNIARHLHGSTNKTREVKTVYHRVRPAKTPLKTRFRIRNDPNSGSIPIGKPPRDFR